MLPGQDLIVYNYRRQVPLRQQSRQITYRQKVELFVQRLSCNFAEMTASSPFLSMFLATNLQVIDDDIEVIL